MDVCRVIAVGLSVLYFIDLCIQFTCHGQYLTSRDHIIISNDLLTVELSVKLECYLWKYCYDVYNLSPIPFIGDFRENGCFAWNDDSAVYNSEYINNPMLLMEFEV